MVILDEVKRRLSELAPEVTDLHDALAIERSRVRLEELEQKSASPEFYDDAAASGAVFAEMGELKDRLEQYAALQTFPLKLKGGCQRHNIEIAGGQKVIQLQGINPLRGAGIAHGVPVNIVIMFQRLNVLHGAKK